MPSYRLIALTNAIAGQEDEFNRFYTEQHIPDVLAVPGVVAAQRFHIAGDPARIASAPHRYLAIYEIEAENLADVAGEIARRSGAGTVRKNPYQDPKASVSFFQAITPRMTG